MMRRVSAFLMGSFLLCAISGSAFAQQANSLPSSDDIHKMVNEGKYRDALKALFPILQLKPPASLAYDHYDMLMLRAECQLQIKENVAALATLDTLRKDAEAEGKQDIIAKASAFAQLIKKSPGGNYVPKTGANHAAINILTKDGRTAGYHALFIDENAVFQQTLNTALEAKSLPPIVTAAKAARDLRAIELMANGNNKETDDAIAKLPAKAADLMNAALDDIMTQVTRISANANQLITYNADMVDGSGRHFYGQQTRRRGLSSQDLPTLKDFKTTADRITASVNDFVNNLHMDSNTANALTAKVQTVKIKVDTVINTDYNTAP